MMLMEIGQAMWGSATRAVDAIALAPSPGPEPKTINTDAILNFFTTKIVPILLGDPNPSPMMVTWGLSETLAYLDHLERLDEARRVDTEPSDRWALAA